MPRVTARSVHRRVAGFAATVIVAHHVNTVFGPLGYVGTTRWADWVDLLVPYVVVGTAAAVLAATRAGRREWFALAATAILYTQGHGIHLAANSIAGIEPSDAVYLWDETVGHWLWYSGLAGLVATLAYTVREVPATRSVWAFVLSLGFGFTICTNSIEGGTAALGLVCGIVFVAWGVRERGRLPELLAPAYAVAFVGLVGWGVYWQGFPQFSELGWI
jgi:hypothetical protein